MAYITKARERAGRRRSPWNLLLIPAYIVPWTFLTFGVAFLAGDLYSSVHAGAAFRVLPDSVGGVLIGLGSLFACLGPSMVLANLLVSIVPAARRALDAEGSDALGTSRKAANRGLLKVSCILTPAGLLVALLGVLVDPR